MDKYACERISYRVCEFRLSTLKNYITGFYLNEFTDTELIAKLRGLFSEEMRSLTHSDKLWIEKQRDIRGEAAPINGG